MSPSDIVSKSDGDPQEREDLARPPVVTHPRTAETDQLLPYFGRSQSHGDERLAVVDRRTSPSGMGMM